MDPERPSEAGRGGGRAWIVGLGNPGDSYDATRHNVGFRVVAELARRRGLRLRGRECNALVGEEPTLLLALPQTYMNRSGYSVRCLAERRGLLPGDLLVVFDEVHLPLGRLRLRSSGSPGGHRGMESIVESLQTREVARLRLGVGREEPVPGEDLADFVLAPFAKDERPTAEEMVQRAADACESWLAEGAEVAMRKFNG